MLDMMYILKRYEGKGKGKPYTDIYDDLRIIVFNLSSCIYSNDVKSIDYLISHYKRYSFISNIVVDGNKCVITGKYNIEFRVMTKEFIDIFCKDVFFSNDISGNCHYTAQKILEDCHSENICAVTSLCVNTNFSFYFHSYIYDSNRNNVIDFSKKVIMNKEQYDKIFCHREINTLNYSEYSFELLNSGYDENNMLFPLLYLALNKLEHEDCKVYKK